jgi:hypothetical protein
MSRTSPKDAAVRRTADNQAGLITSAQLAEIGVRTSTVSRRCVGGMWTRVLPGVHLVDGGFPSRHQRERAALLYAGEPSMITGMTGLRHHAIRAVRLQEVADDVPERPEPVHTLINHDVRRLSTGYVRIERTRRLPQDAVRRDGLLIAPVARCVGDAVRRSRNASDVDALVAEVVQRGLATVAQLDAELAGGHAAGVRCSATLLRLLQPARCPARRRT